MKRLVVASVLVLAIYSYGRHTRIKKDDANDTLLVFYVNSYVDEYKEPYLKYRRKYEKELRRKGTARRKIYRVEHKSK